MFFDTEFSIDPLTHRMAEPEFSPADIHEVVHMDRTQRAELLGNMSLAELNVLNRTLSFEVEARETVAAHRRLMTGGEK